MADQDQRRRRLAVAPTSRAAGSASPARPVLDRPRSAVGVLARRHRAAAVTPLRLPSSASLASRSACLFCSRGTQVYVVPNGASRLASSASGFMSGCLIFQWPDICSTTSLESIRTSISASGRELRGQLAARRSGRSTPRRCWWRRRSCVPSSAITSPVSASLSTAPYAAGPGLPREPPSASMTTVAVAAAVAHSPDSAVRTRIRWHSSQRSTSSSAAARITAELGVVEAELAAAALARRAARRRRRRPSRRAAGRRAPAGRRAARRRRARARRRRSASSASISAVLLVAGAARSSAQPLVGGRELGG